MPAVRKTSTSVAAALCLFGLTVLPIFSGSTLSADETQEPRPLRIPAQVHGLNDPLYRTNETLPASSNQLPSQDATVANEATGERPASLESLEADGHPLVPWTKAPRARTHAESDKPSKSGASDLSGQVIKPKQPLNQQEGGTLALRRSGGEEKTVSTRGVSSGLGTMFASLFLVLGLFFLAAWMIKKGMPKGASLLPSEVVEVLGRAPLGGKQQVHLLRVGNKMLLVSISAGGAETLTEITDPVEVDRLAGLCQQQSPYSSTNAFKQIFQQFARRGEADLVDEPLAAAGKIGTREVLHG